MPEGSRLPYAGRTEPSGHAGLVKSTRAVGFKGGLWAGFKPTQNPSLTPPSMMAKGWAQKSDGRLGLDGQVPCLVKSTMPARQVQSTVQSSSRPSMAHVPPQAVQPLNNLLNDFCEGYTGSLNIRRDFAVNHLYPLLNRWRVQGMLNLTSEALFADGLDWLTNRLDGENCDEDCGPLVTSNTTEHAEDPVNN